MLRWTSNKAPVADREFTIARVRAGSIELMPDQKTGKFVGVFPDDEFPMTVELEMPTSNETLGRRLIPVASPYTLKDLTINSVAYAPDWSPTSPLVVASGPYTLSLAEDGNGTVAYDSADIAQFPADGVSTTAFTVSQFRVRQYVNGVEEVSAQKGPVLIKIKGQTVASDTTAPVLQSVAPAGTSVVVGTDITLTFDETVLRGANVNLYLRNVAQGATIETFDLDTAPTSGAGSVAINGNVVTVNPTSDLPAGTQVSVRYDAGAFKDAANNNVAALSTDTWSFTTASAGGSTGGGGLYVLAIPDTTVTSAAEARTLLTTWAANWNGTVPAGKTASDWRVLGLSGVYTGLDLSGITLPQRVYVRHVGTFASDHTCTSYIQGQPSITNSTNIWLYLLDLRSPSNAAFFNGYIACNNTVDCGIVRCSLTGWPFTVADGAHGTTGYAYVPVGGTRLTIAHNYYRYMGDGHMKFDGTHTSPIIRGNMGRYSGGDDYTIASSGTVNDPLWEANFLDRKHSKQFGTHNDGMQVNLSGKMNRTVSRYNVFYRGTWTGAGEATSNGWQAWYTAAGSATNAGPTLAEHNLYYNGQQKGIDRPANHTATMTVRYCDAVDSNVAAAQRANAAFPSIRGADAVERNFVTVPNAAYANQEGTNGIRVTISGGDYSPLLTYMETVPTDTTDLWAVRPKTGARKHPDYAPAADRVGAFDFWAKMLAGDPLVCLSKVGWPIAPGFIADFDTGDNFWGGYTGTFDANGDNA